MPDLTIRITQQGKKTKILTTSIDPYYKDLDRFAALCRNLFNFEKTLNDISGSNIKISFHLKG